MPLRDLGPRDAVVVYLHEPREKMWGILQSIGPSGIVVRCLDLVFFDEWMRQEAHGAEPLVGLTTIFYPLGRVERLERDETVGPVVSYADRFEREVGRSVWDSLGLDPPDA